MSSRNNGFKPRRRARRNGRRGGNRAGANQQARRQIAANPIPKYRLTSGAMGGQVVPDTMFAKLRATAQLTFTSTVTTDDFVILANSAFDPFGAESAIQPQGFDQWANFYGSYRVWETAITVRTTPFSPTTEGVNQFIAVFPSVSSTAITSDVSALSHPFVRWRNISGADSSAVVTVPQIIRHRRASPTQFGFQAVPFEGNTSAGAAVTASPSLLWYWHVFTGATSTNIIGATVTIELVQTIQFFNRAEVADAESIITRVNEMAVSLKNRKPLNHHRLRGSETTIAVVEVKHQPPEKKGESTLAGKVNWADQDESDEAIYADFQRWKRATAGAGSIASKPASSGNDQKANLLPSQPTKTGVG